MSVWAMLENGVCRSFTPVIDWSLVTIVMKALISDPVASVPMKESTPRPTTTKPLMRPIASAAPRASRTAGTTPTPVCATKCATVTPLSVIVKAIERSNTRAASGMTTHSAMSPVTALLLRIWLKVVCVRNVFGTQIAKTRMMSSHT